MKLSNLITDEKTGRYSSTKIWMHIGNIVLSYALIKQVPNGLTDMHMVMYGIIVCGNVTLTSFIKWRFRDGVSDLPKE